MTINKMIDDIERIDAITIIEVTLFNCKLSELFEIFNILLPFPSVTKSVN